jgi:ParB family transcriptional regulator, chromosome partitioning protein
MSVERKSRLGKGLGALLGDNYLAAATEGFEVRSLPLAAIVPNPYQPRREFRPEELADLQRSIQENGLLQPVVVRPTGPGGSERFELVAGERRLRSVTALGWERVPAVVREVDDRTLLVLALVENLQREELNPLEEAEGYRRLMQEFSLTQGEVAEAVGKGRPTIANALRLLNLPPSVRRLLDDGSLTMGHARALLSLGDPVRMGELARRVIQEGWSVREVEDRIRRWQAPLPGAEEEGSGAPLPGSGGGSTRGPALRLLEEELGRRLGTRVQLTGRGGEGTIRIPFGSSEELERLFELITGADLSDIIG